MAASVTDKFKKYSDGSKPPTIATVSSPRSTGATTLACNDLSGWATDTGVNFITYRLDTANAVVVGSITYWVGIVSGNNLTNVVRVKGAADGGNSINDVVMEVPDSDRFDDLVDGILTHTDQDGTLKAGAVDTTAVLANSIVTSSKLNLSKTTDANGWTVYDYGSFKQYSKKFTLATTSMVASGRYAVVSGTNLPVGKTASDVIISGIATGTAEAGRLNVGIEGLSGSTFSVVISHVSTTTISQTGIVVHITVLDA